MTSLLIVVGVANNVVEALANGTVLGTDVPAVVQKLFQAVHPTATPTSIPDALNKAAAAWGIKNANSAPPPVENILENVLQLVLDGFTSSDVKAVAAGAVSHCPTGYMKCS